MGERWEGGDDSPHRRASKTKAAIRSLQAARPPSAAGRDVAVVDSSVLVSSSVIEAWLAG